ncbi:MAG: tRNA (adenosine(37)-N6)-threonylcarbamoyltransferase complex ATPase subunit type 1 TsaE [Gammaproteobacteria bacterium]|nr:tRNA (adenosine(37)-N6)-threonylcarbamoyltransferase complex ATPase subunit type 1 TsaE [Gammaproteobacteria bacterium]
MSARGPLERVLADADSTERLGAALARALPPGGMQPVIVSLHGQLGAGKTTLVRGLLRELGVSGAVRSPSYTLLETYDCADRRVLHLDLYRLAGSADVAGLGLRDELLPGVLLLVEWPERAAGSLPAADLEIWLFAPAEGRIARLQAEGPTGQAWLDVLGNQE